MAPSRAASSGLQSSGETAGLRQWAWRAPLLSSASSRTRPALERARERERERYGLLAGATCARHIVVAADIVVRVSLMQRLALIKRLSFGWGTHCCCCCLGQKQVALICVRAPLSLLTRFLSSVSSLPRVVSLTRPACRTLDDMMDSAGLDSAGLETAQDSTGSGSSAQSGPSEGDPKPKYQAARRTGRGRSSGGC